MFSNVNSVIKTSSITLLSLLIGNMAHAVEIKSSSVLPIKGNAPVFVVTELDALKERVGLSLDTGTDTIYLNDRASATPDKMVIPSKDTVLSELVVGFDIGSLDFTTVMTDSDGDTDVNIDFQPQGDIVWKKDGVVISDLSKSMCEADGVYTVEIGGTISPTSKFGDPAVGAPIDVTRSYTVVQNCADGTGVAQYLKPLSNTTSATKAVLDGYGFVNDKGFDATVETPVSHRKFPSFAFINAAFDIMIDGSAKYFTFTSSDPTNVAVDEKGRVKFKGMPTAPVTLTVANKFTGDVTFSHTFEIQNWVEMQHYPRVCAYVPNGGADDCEVKCYKDYGPTGVFSNTGAEFPKVSIITNAKTELNKDEYGLRGIGTFIGEWGYDVASYSTGKDPVTGAPSILYGAPQFVTSNTGNNGRQVVTVSSGKINSISNNIETFYLCATGDPMKELKMAPTSAVTPP